MSIGGLCCSLRRQPSSPVSEAANCNAVDKGQDPQDVGHNLKHHSQLLHSLLDAGKYVRRLCCPCETLSKLGPFQMLALSWCAVWICVKTSLLQLKARLISLKWPRPNCCLWKWVCQVTRLEHVKPRRRNKWAWHLLSVPLGFAQNLSF